MTPDPRAALARLVATLEDHLAAAANRRGETDPAVADAYQRVADAFEAYEEALYDAYDEVTPFVLYDDVEDERDDDEDDSEDDSDDEDESDEDGDEDEEDDDEEGDEGTEVDGSTPGAR